MRRLLLIAALVGFAPAPDVHAGACARMGLDAQILAHPADTIPAGGGILVGYGPGQGYGGSGLGGDDPSVQKDWKIRQKKKKLRTTITTIAPGLSVYTAKVRGKVTLNDAKGKKLGTYSFSRTSQPFTAAAPSLKDVTVTSTPTYRSGTSTAATVTLDAAPPSDAFALVLYDGTTPLSWVEIDGSGGTSIVVYRSPGRCGAQPSGMTPPYGGQKVEVAWVDRFGRVSPHSAAVATIDGGSGGGSGAIIGP